MKSRSETFRREKTELVRQKDTERKQAVEEVQDQCERDYKQFTADHHDTLTLALKTAREQHSREKVYRTYSGFSRAIKTEQWNTKPQASSTYAKDNGI